MVGPIMAKLFGCMMDRKMSTWAEKNAKRVMGQAGFRAKHSTIDHLITLRVIMEESKDLSPTLSGIYNVLILLYADLTNQSGMR